MNTHAAHRTCPRTIESTDLELIVGGTDPTPTSKTSSTRGSIEIVVTKSTDTASTN
jgi:hypothetical protein